MGRSKRKEPVRGQRGKPNTITINSATNEIIRDQKILPIIAGIASATEERKQSLAAIPNLVKDETCRKLLLKDKIVKKLLDGPLTDPTDECVMLSWAALRSLVAEEGYDIAIHLYREKILVPAKEAVENIKVGIQNIVTNPSSMPGGSQAVLWECADTIISLLKSVCETNQKALRDVAIPEILEFLMGVLNPDAHAPEKVQASSGMCLLSLVEENEDLAKSFATRPDHMELLVKLSDVLADDLFVQLRTASTCGIIHSLGLEMDLLEKGMAQNFDISELTITATLTKILKANQNYAQTVDTQALVLETALEVLAGLATNVQFDLEEGPGEANDTGVDDQDDEMNEDDEEEGGEDDGSDDDMDEIEADMADVVGEEGSIGAAKSKIHLPAATEQILKLFLEDIAASTLSIASVPATTTLGSSVQLRALTLLNNLGWIGVELIDNFPPALKQYWTEFSLEIWNKCVTPVLLSSTADVELAETLAGLCWALARANKGNLDVSSGQHKAFMALYAATEEPGLKAKCIGVVGNLALAQGRVDINAEIGAFLIEVVSALPKTPTEAAVEALDVLYEVYADAAFDYDEPVFVKRGYLEELRKVAPKVKQMAKKVDKRTMPELRERADEVQLNLGRFISYKTTERRGK